MKKFKSEKGGVTVFVIIAFLFILTLLISIYMKNTNYQISVLQAEQRLKNIYGEDVNNVSEIYYQMALNSKGVNMPKITEGMIPIKWNGTNWVVCARDDEEWYDYATADEVEATKDLEEGKRTMSWANMMLSDGTYKADTVEVGQVVADSDLGSMFVWIPRYAYSMTHYKTEIAAAGADEATYDGKTQNITRVVFLKGTTNEDAAGNRYAKDYNADSQIEGSETDMIVHPAFNFGGKELTGIWVAKFEASMAEANTNTTENNNVANKTVKILPNKVSWRYIQIGNAFAECYNMKEKSIYGLSTNANTHLMKNNEWGAVAYLAASQYGTIPKRNSNSSYYTGGNNYVTNKAQSTTGTVNGVYDLNGGAWEYVAAYYDNGNSNLAKGNSTVLAMFDSSNSYKLKSEYAAFWDKYEVEGDDGAAGYNSSTKDNDKIAKAAYGRVQKMKSVKGDAMYEVIKDSDISIYGWLKDDNGDYTSTNNWIKAHFTKSGSTLTVTYPSGEKSASNATGLYDGDYVRIGTSVRPSVIRGGGSYNGTSAGVFCIVGYSGSANGDGGFRPVVW